MTHGRGGTGFVVLRHPHTLGFVCETCKAGEHETCRRGTWCDCGHRAPRS